MGERQPERGDLVCVSWVDIAEDSVGNPDEAALARRTSYGLFWGKSEDEGIPVYVTTTTIDSDDAAHSGWCCYPISCVVKLTIIKRARRRKK